MKYIICIIIFIVAYYLSVCFRIALSHPFKTIKNCIVDLFYYIRYCKWRECHKADLVCYTGLFGKGKTLSAVHAIYTMYNKYNNKKVYDKSRKKWVTQQVRVISNVNLTSIPFEYMKSLSQIVSFAEKQGELDKENDTLTLLFVLIDEASVQLNSRNFKDNIDANFLNTLLTCRHYHICGIYTTSQRFKLEDKLLRDVTQKVVECKKVWRFQKTTYYDAWELENAQNVTLIKPLLRTGFFVTNQDYANYDTLACVEDLAKSCKEGDMLSEEEILALRCDNGSDMSVVTNTSKEYKRKVKQENKKR